MKNGISIAGAALALALALAAGNASAQDLAARTGTARDLVKDFGGALRAELTSAMQSGGPIAAVDTCSKVAQPLAERKSAASGWKIGRTTLGVRNPADAPDAWERKVLEEFDARAAKGENPDAIERAEIVTENGKPVFRFMKAIPVAEACLTCHGKEVAPDLMTEIKKRYPGDQGTGYALGQLRGAFTLRQPL